MDHRGRTIAAVDEGLGEISSVRYERGSTNSTSDKSLIERASVVQDVSSVTELVDRLAHRSQVFRLQVGPGGLADGGRRAMAQKALE